MGPAIQAFGFLIVFGSILFLVYVTTRYVGGKAGKVMRGKNISIIETVNLGLDKQIHLVKAGETFLLIASSGKSIQFLTTVNIDNYEQAEMPENLNGFDFKEFFEKYLQNFKSRPGKKNTALFGKEMTNVQIEGDDFKSNLNKLRAITKRASDQSTYSGDDNTNEK